MHDPGDDDETNSGDFIDAPVEEGGVRCSQVQASAVWCADARCLCDKGCDGRAELRWAVEASMSAWRSVREREGGGGGGAVDET